MKRLMVATSVLALSLGGVAFAQGNSGAAGMSGSEPATHGQANMTQSQGNMDENNTQASSTDVKQAQQALKDQGLYHGAIDGRWGPETKQAVNEFQKKNGLKQTAQLDDQTKDQLQHADNDSNQNSGTANDNNRSEENGTAGRNVSPNSENQTR